MNANSNGEKVSTNNSIELEIDRLSQEVNVQRGRAERWDSWNIGLLFLAGIVASGLVITALGVSKSNRSLIRLSDSLERAKDRKLQEDLKTKDDEIAKLDNESAKAKLETEKLKQVVAWRVFSPTEASVLENALAAHPGSVNLRYTDSDPEALFFAIQISQILAKAKWQVAPGASKPANTIVFGIDLPDANSSDAQKLRAAFSAAKIPFATIPLPEAGVGFSVATIAGAPTLMIGSRKPVLP